MPGKYNKAYRRKVREQAGRVEKTIEFPAQSWDDLKTHVDRLNKKGATWTIWGALNEGIGLFIKHHK